MQRVEGGGGVAKRSGKVPLSPKYMIVTCLTHRDGVGGGRGRGVGRRGLGISGAKRLGEKRVTSWLIGAFDFSLMLSFLLSAFYRICCLFSNQMPIKCCPL